MVFKSFPIFPKKCVIIYYLNLKAMLNNAYRYFAGSYFQLIHLTIIIKACIGSVAVYYTLRGIPDLWDMIQLLCCVAATTSYLGAILAQVHLRKVFHIFMFGIIINILLLTILLAG